MKAFIILALVAAAAADVSHLKHSQHHHVSSGPDAEAQILQQEVNVQPNGFDQSYQTSNGISAQEKGELKNLGQDGEAISVQGSNSYTAPDGQQIQTQYVADENGYQPQGAHLPTSPPVPEAIARALAYIAAHPPQPEVGQQQYKKNY